MKKSLLILPGAVDPFHKDGKKDFSERYNLIIDEAKKRGYNQIKLLPWIGQNSGGNGLMNLKTGTTLLTTEIYEREMKKEDYDIIAFSWGANVYLNTLSNIKQPAYLKRTVLWGIDEFWRMASYFSTVDKAKSIIQYMNMHGTNIDPKFITYVIPNESMLLDYKHSNLIRIGFGEYDEESPPGYAYYLQSMGLKKNIECKVIPEVGHVVTEPIDNYLNCLFEDFK